MSAGKTILTFAENDKFTVCIEIARWPYREKRNRHLRRLAIATLLFMLIWSGGCMPNLIPQPSPQPKAETQTVRIEVVGEGKVNVGGDATITAKPAAGPTEPARVCVCGCGQEGCTCSRGQNSAASTVGTSARSGPQRITQKVYQCRNGVCGWYDVEVSPIASVSKRPASASTQGGRIKVYVGDSPACRAMQRDLAGRDDIEFVTGTPPEINGNRWWPTAVKPDGSRWSPAQAGWDANSLRLFEQWRTGQ